MNPILQFLLSFLLLLVIGTLAVDGWFFITRGWFETLPNGLKIRKGKIFKGWYFFITQTTGFSRVYYEGAELRKLCEQFKHLFGQNLTVHHGCVSIVHAGSTYEGVMQMLADNYDIGWLPKGDGYYSIYKELPVYRFPEWVRHPLAACATCHASVYGSLFYWAAMGFVGPYLFAPFNLALPILAMAGCWIVFCLSLAVTLTAVAKKWN